MNQPFSILLLAILFTITSCVKEPHQPTPVLSHTLLVYVGTDNNLSGYEQEKLQAIRDGWSGKSTDKVIVYIDKGRGADARLIEISNLLPTDAPREIAAYGEENSASAEVFSRVVRDVKSMYPADSYGLLVFSHASGWLPSGALTNPGKVSPETTSESFVVELEIVPDSIIIDGTDEMEICDFASSIPDGMFDYIVFEGCFMAGIEVAYELRHKTPVIFASSAEIVHPGFAPVYPTSTTNLLNSDIQGFAEQVFDNIQSYSESDPQRSATYSVIHTSGLEALAVFIRDNCDFTQTVNISDIQHFDRLNGYRLFFDFEDYYGKLLQTNEQREELFRLLSVCVVWKASTTAFLTQLSGYNGFKINKHSGMTTYIPQDRFPGLNSRYSELLWSESVFINIQK